MERVNYGRGRGRDGGGGRRGGRGRFGGDGRDQQRQSQYHQLNQGGGGGRGRGRGGRDQQQHQHYRPQGQYHQHNQGGGGRGGVGRGLSYGAASAVQPRAQQWGPPLPYGSAGESSARGAGGPRPSAWRHATPSAPPQPDRAPEPPASGETSLGTDSRTLKILSYNVWFREDLEMDKRMKALGDLIQLHSPDLICFQEVTPNIYDIFRQSNWWKAYRCSVSNEMAFTRPYFCMQLSKLLVKSYSCKPFSNSRMGRELCVAEVEIQADMTLVVATSHLESPCPAPPKWDQMFSKERVDQAQEAVNFLNKNPNVIFCGDMNWDDELDGQFPLPEGWIDAWTQLRPGENGFTYDTKSNQMLSGNRPLQKRLDRFICNLRDFEIRSMDMIGTEAIPGLTHLKEKRVRNTVRNLVLPVLPSDHYGLLLTICTQ